MNNDNNSNNNNNNKKKKHRKGRQDQAWCPYKVWSLPNMLTLLLGLLYLAILITRQEVLLMDLLRWCRSGHIPFPSAHLTINRVLRSYAPHCPVFLKVPRVPLSSAVRRAACQLALALSLQAIPFPSAGQIIKRLVDVLHLPEETTRMAEEVVSLRRLAQQRHEQVEEGLRKGEVPAVECQAAAALLVTLKICCGLNDSSEHHLSVVAARVNEAVQAGGGGGGGDLKFHPLFSFDEWMRYIVEVGWLSRQMDPLSEVIAPPAVLSRSSEIKLMGNLSRLLTFCCGDPAVSLPDLTKYPNLRRQLETLHLSLEGLCQAHFRGSVPPYDPLLGTLEKYVSWHSSSSSVSPSSTPTSDHGCQQEISSRFLLRARKLLQTTFASTQLLWPHRLHHIQHQLRKVGSAIHLKGVKYPHSLCPRPTKPGERTRHQGERSNVRKKEEPGHKTNYRKASSHLHAKDLCSGDGRGCNVKRKERTGCKVNHKLCSYSDTNNISSECDSEEEYKDRRGPDHGMQRRKCSFHTHTKNMHLEGANMCKLKNMKESVQKRGHMKSYCCRRTPNPYSGDGRVSLPKTAGEIEYKSEGYMYELNNTEESVQKEQQMKCTCHSHTPNPSLYNLPHTSHDSKMRQKYEDIYSSTSSTSHTSRDKRRERKVQDTCSSTSDNSHTSRDKRRERKLQDTCSSTSDNSHASRDKGRQRKLQDTCSSTSDNSHTSRDKGRQRKLQDTCSSTSDNSHVSRDKGRQRKLQDTCSSTSDNSHTSRDKGRQRKLQDTCSSTLHDPLSTNNNCNRKGKALYNSKNVDYKDEETTSTSTSTSDTSSSNLSSFWSSSSSSSSSVLAHESLDMLLQEGTSATALGQTLLVPVPAYRVWQGPDVSKGRWQEMWSTLPRSYRGVVEVLVSLCMVTRREVLEEALAMEKAVEIYSSLLFLFPDPSCE